MTNFRLRPAPNVSPHRIWRALLVAASMAMAAPLHAETHALILTIGNYAQPSAKLRGIDADARLAQEIVRRMGATHVQQLADGRLDFFGLRNAVTALQARVQKGDALIIYFSGHGKRRTRGDLPGHCQVGLVSVDGRYYLDTLFEADLQALARVADHVVVFNDSCHAGGAVAQAKSLRGDDEELQIKAYPDELEDLPQAKGSQAGSKQDAEDDACARISNPETKSFRELGPEDKISYLAAAAPDEAAWASPRGSLATLAWHRCLVDPPVRVDTDGDGYISANELARCANRFLPSISEGRRQTVMAMFNARARLARANAR